MKIQVHGAGKTVTGSCYSVEVGKHTILIDCGMFQGSKQLQKQNYEAFHFKPSQIDAVLLTHAHLDHCGRIPKLIHHGFKGKIIATTATKDLAEVVMLDAAHIAEMETKYENEDRAKKNLPPREPIYNEEDVKKTIQQFETVAYHTTIEPIPGVKATYHNAGHILGAAFIELTVSENNKETTIVFSGDLGQLNTPIVPDHEIINKADYVFIESTYGNRLHPDIISRRNELLKIVLNTYEKGGKLLIPSFAIERTQELLYDLNDLFEKNLIPKMPVYLDSPMAIKATEVFKKHPGYYDKEVKQLLRSGDNPFHFPGLSYSPTVQDSIAIKSVQPCIVIAGSGMCTAGRIKHHILNHIGEEKNTILFVGYQAQGSLGFWIKKGEKHIKLLGKHATVRASVESIDSFSAHADYEELLNWLRHISPKPKKVFVVHGEEKSQKEFSKKVKDIGFEPHIPDMYEIITV